MSKLTVQLSGYFDNNFGDDYIMKVIANSLPEINFVVDGREKVNSVLCEEPNVFIQNNIANLKYPKLVVTGCGFMINSKTALYSELVYLLKGKSPGDYCLGCNIEPLDSFVKRWLIRRKLNKFKLIACRDKKSLWWLRKFVAKPKKEYLPDILFGLPDSWLPGKKDGNNLGISLMHRKGDTEDCKYYKDMADIADFWIERTGHGVVLMAFNSGSEDDIYSCKCVKKLMKYPEKTKIVVHKSGGEIFEAYSECAKIIGARFHSAVLAFKMGLPFFPIVYRDKTKNLIDDLEYPVCGCKIDEVDVAAVCTFLFEEQTSFHLEEDIFACADKYAHLFRRCL